MQTFFFGPSLLKLCMFVWTHMHIPTHRCYRNPLLLVANLMKQLWWTQKLQPHFINYEAYPQQLLKILPTLTLSDTTVWYLGLLWTLPTFRRITPEGKVFLQAATAVPGSMTRRGFDERHIVCLFYLIGQNPAAAESSPWKTQSGRAKTVRIHVRNQQFLIATKGPLCHVAYWNDWRKLVNMLVIALHLHFHMLLIEKNNGYMWNNSNN